MQTFRTASQGDGIEREYRGEFWQTWPATVNRIERGQRRHLIHNKVNGVLLTENETRLEHILWITLAKRVVRIGDCKCTYIQRRSGQGGT